MNTYEQSKNPLYAINMNLIGSCYNFIGNQVNI